MHHPAAKNTIRQDGTETHRRSPFPSREGGQGVRSAHGHKSRCVITRAATVWTDERVTGAIDYTANTRVAGCLVARLVTSPYPHARSPISRSNCPLFWCL